jgi:hypothetical protein
VSTRAIPIAAPKKQKNERDARHQILHRTPSKKKDTAPRHKSPSFKNSMQPGKYIFFLGNRNLEFEAATNPIYVRR